jgi:hypothetical protein
MSVRATYSAASIRGVQAIGTFWSNDVLLYGTPSYVDGYLGQRVAISADGNYMITVGYYPDSSTPAVYVFVRSGSTWSQQTILSTGVTSDQFGDSIDINGDGTCIVVGASATLTSGVYTGAAYVYTRSGTTWTQQQILKASPLSTGFGSSIAINNAGTYIVVGETSGGGKAYIFNYSGSTWSQQQAVSPTVGTTYFTLGGVAINDSGDYIVGSDPSNSTYKGAAWVFTRSGTTWTQQQILTQSVRSNNSNFGTCPSFNSTGDKVMFGAPGYNSTGAGYYFTRSGTTWTQQQILTASNTQSLGVAHSVSMNGTGDVAIFTGLRAGSGSQPNYVYVFYLQNGTWNLIQILSNNLVYPANTEFGSATAIAKTSNYMAIGDDRIDNGATQSTGGVYIYSS